MKGLNLPSPEGAEMGKELARFADVEEAKLRAAGLPVPKRCSDCALRLGTIPNQCTQTLFDILVCSATHEDFMCHLSSDAEGDPTKLCRGFELLRISRLQPKDVAGVLENALAKGDRT
jgi:hypothetical protein